MEIKSLREMEGYGLLYAVTYLKTGPNYGYWAVISMEQPSASTDLLSFSSPDDPAICYTEGRSHLYTPARNIGLVEGIITNGKTFTTKEEAEEYKSSIRMQAFKIEYLEEDYALDESEGHNLPEAVIDAFQNQSDAWV